LASEGGFAGAVLDAGCATGENALHVASLGLSVLGVDLAETALAIARAKADERGIKVEFAAADAFQLERLGRRFETVLDCGLFHTFDGDQPAPGNLVRGHRWRVFPPAGGSAVVSPVTPAGQQPPRTLHQRRAG